MVNLRWRATPLKSITIQINQLKVKTILGVKPRERKKKQRVIIDVILKVNGEKAIKTDDIQMACDYDLLSKKIREATEKSQFFLLEKLNDHLLKLVMNEPLVLAATVRIEKPGALLMAESVFTELSAKR